MNVFDAINNQDSLAIILWLLGAALIGFITAWLYWRRRYDTLEGEANETKSQLNTSNEANGELKQKLGLSKADNTKLSGELQTAKALIKSVEIEKGDLHTQIYKLKDSLKLEEEAKLEYGKKLENTDGDIAALQAALDTANDDTRKANDKIEVLKGKIAGLQEELANTKSGGDTSIDTSELDALRAALESAESDSRKANARIEVYKAKLDGLQEELSQTQVAYKDLLNSANNVTSSSNDDDVPDLSDDEKAAVAAEKIAKAFGVKLSTSTEAEKNDLTVIKGIGTFIEAKLNGLGINSYKQVSEFDGELIEDVTEAIQFFPGRIQRDDWVGQAKALVGASNDEVEISAEEKIAQAKTTLSSLIGTKISAAAEGEQDDLKSINGIGPFIEAKLNDLGICTYKQISEFDSDVIDIVTDAIAFFPGRIERDEWVNQARTLMEG